MFTKEAALMLCVASLWGICSSGCVRRPRLVEAFCDHNGDLQPGETCFSYAESFDPAGGTPSANLAWTDWNQDGIPDASTISQRNEIFYFERFLNDGEKVFVADAPLAIENPLAAVAAADLGGSPRPDVVFASGSLLRVYLQRDAGDFEAGDVFDLKKPIHALKSVDLNADGRAELLASSQGTLFVLRAPYDSPEEISLPGSGDLLTTADVDGDDALDLVVASKSGAVTLLFNEAGEFTRQETYQTEPELAVVTMADLDGDGSPELLTGSTEGPLCILFNNGAGEYRQERVLHLLLNEFKIRPVGIVVGDFDFDGEADIAALDRDSGTINIVLNGGHDRFRKFITLSRRISDIVPASFSALDLNDDGLLDFAVLTEHGLEVSFAKP